MSVSELTSIDATGTACGPGDPRHSGTNSDIARLDVRGRKGIAIIGMSCLFPSAPDLDAYWRNILGKVDAVTDPPPESQEPQRYFDPNSIDPDRVYCKRGGYLGSLATFDPLSHGIPPIAVGGEPDQWLALRLAYDAMADAGCLQLDESVRRKTAVILGKGTYLNAGNAIAVQHGLVVNQTLEILRTLHPEYTDADIEALRQELKRALPPFNPETMAGLVPNVIVGRIANRLDLMGPTYTVDAACASSLIAVQQAMRHLMDGECELALAGGSQVWIPMPTLSIFCQLGALSRRQQIRPFDKQADGTLLGEGIGMLVLKRVADAERDGDRIYAVIRGVGVASDGRGASVMAPRVEGEELALRRAYDSAGVSPRTVGLIEAHGTGTSVGDLVEVQALTGVFGPRGEKLPWCALGSVKSMISHTIPAAGVAGIIKVALSLHHKVLPPTINCDEPNPKLELDQTPFYISSEVRPWVHGGPEPRRAGVNAFGFGGINAHVVLEEDTEAPGIRPEFRDTNGKPNRTRFDGPDHLPDWDCEVCVLGGESPSELSHEIRRLADFLDSLSDGSSASDPRGGNAGDRRVQLKDLAYTLNHELMTSTSGSRFRLALVAGSLADLREKLARAERRLSAPEGCRQIRDVSGIYFASEPLGLAGKLAFLFPGEGSQYPHMLADLCLHFPEVRWCFDQIDRVYHDHPRGYVPSDHIFPRRSFGEQTRGQVGDRLWEIAGAVEAVLTANQGLYAVLRGLGLRPDVIAGHSTGEFSAVQAAGIFDPDKEHFGDFIRELYRNYEEASRNGVPRAVMLAVGADRERLEAIARVAEGEVYVAMDNCPHQAVLVGEQQAADRALEIVRREGLIFERLNFDRAYHTPLFAPYADHLRRIFENASIHSSHTPVYSCATAGPYPSDPDQVRSLLVDQWLQPVEFRRTIEALYADGVRLFVESGPRGNLTSFVEDSLRGRPFCAVPANVTRRSGIAQLNHLVAILTAQGINLDFTYLYRWRRTRRVDWQRQGIAGASKRCSAQLKLATGFPSMRLSDGFAQRLRADHSAFDREDLQERPPRASEAPDTQEESELSSTWDHGVAEPRPALDDLPSSSPGGPSRDSMIRDFLQTMDRFLVVQERVIQDCLGPGLTSSSDPDAMPVDGPVPLPTRQGIDPAYSQRGAEQAEGRQRLPVLGDIEPASASRAPREHPFPLLGDIVTWSAGQMVVTRRSFDTAEDLYLRDHTLGNAVSDVDPELIALAVMPLTMSMEIMAEAAAFLMPDRTVVGLRDLRAHRWIAFDDGPQELEVTARRQPREDTVVVELRNLTEDGRQRVPLVSPVIQATVVLADRYPQASITRPRRPRDGRASRLQSELLYSEYLFHGPTWQGVSRVEEVGEDGSVAILNVLPSDGMLHGVSAPRFVLDPAVLDATGQVIGFWTMEQLPTGKVIFPYRLESLEIYRPPCPAGSMASCFASIELVGEKQVRSEIEVFAEDGEPWMRLLGWEDKRFDLPAGLETLMLPYYREISTPWLDPIESFPEPSLCECRKVSTRLTSDSSFWKRVWAHRVLSRAEREEFRRMTDADDRQLEWLAGRTAAKEAVRRILHLGYGLDVPPADIEIRLDGRDRLEVDGWWVNSVATPPAVAITIRDGVTVSLASLPLDMSDNELNERLCPGIHLEPMRHDAERAGMRVLSPDEVGILRDLPAEFRDEWVIRCCCAKVVVLKALGMGPSPSTRGVRVVGVEPEAGAVFVQLTESLAEIPLDLASSPLVVFTGIQDGLAWASTLCEPVGSSLTQEATTGSQWIEREQLA